MSSTATGCWRSPPTTAARRWSSAPWTQNRDAGRPIDFWDLWLPRETRAYVPKLLAMKRLVLDPEAYGLAFSPIPNQPYFARVDTHGQIDLKLAAEIAGITPEELYELNPAFHRWATDPAGPHLPAAAGRRRPTCSRPTSRSCPPTSASGSRTTRWSAGDSVASVAKQFHTTVNVVRELNDMPSGGAHGGRRPARAVGASPSCRRRSCWLRRASTGAAAPRDVRTCRSCGAAIRCGPSPAGTA